MEDCIIKDYLINEQIADREVRVIAEDGKTLGIMTIDQALSYAAGLNLDLVKVGEGSPATCKLMDYAKYRYDTIKKEKEARKNQKIIKVKEVQLSIGIELGDLRTKAKKANEFVADGDKVQVVIRLRGRQNKRPELGLKVMSDFAAMVEGAVIEQGPSQEGNTQRMVLAPIKKK